MTPANEELMHAACDEIEAVLTRLPADLAYAAVVEFCTHYLLLRADIRVAVDRRLDRLRTGAEEIANFSEAINKRVSKIIADELRKKKVSNG